MKIVWNKVTVFSQICAIILFVLVFIISFQLGRRFESQFILGTPINSVTFSCADNKSINAVFYAHLVHLELGFQKTLYLQQTISASGARYANNDESIVFWNKGDTAFITEGNPNDVTYKDCVQTGK